MEPEAVRVGADDATDLEELIAFRLEANVNTYAAFMNEVEVLSQVGQGTTVIMRKQIAC